MQDAAKNFGSFQKRKKFIPRTQESIPFPKNTFLTFWDSLHATQTATKMYPQPLDGGDVTKKVLLTQNGTRNSGAPLCASDP